MARIETAAGMAEWLHEIDGYRAKARALDSHIATQWSDQQLRETITELRGLGQGKRVSQAMMPREIAADLLNQCAGAYKLIGQYETAALLQQCAGDIQDGVRDIVVFRGDAAIDGLANACATLLELRRIARKAIVAFADRIRGQVEDGSDNGDAGDKP